MKLILITQDGCNPCQMVKNFLTDAEAPFETINISQSPDAVDEFQVMSTPVTILMDEDEEVGRVNGYSPPDLEVLVSQL